MSMKCAFCFFLLMSFSYISVGGVILPEKDSINPYWPFPLDEVTVTAERMSAHTGAVSFFDSARIAEQPEIMLSDILSQTPGGLIKVDSRGEATFNIRGALNRDTRLYIDGRPVASPWNGYIDLSGISLSDISAITVIKGPPPLRFGSNLGGAINIITEKPVPAPTTGLSMEIASGRSYKSSFQ